VNVAQLIAQLEHFDPEAEIRIASFGHRTALAYHLDDAEGFATDDGTVVYLVEGGQEGYLPSGVREQVGR
jgi:hypothetical protein